MSDAQRHLPAARKVDLTLWSLGDDALPPLIKLTLSEKYLRRAVAKALGRGRSVTDAVVGELDVVLLETLILRRVSDMLEYSFQVQNNGMIYVEFAAAHNEDLEVAADSTFIEVEFPLNTEDKPNPAWRFSLRDLLFEACEDGTDVIKPVIKAIKAAVDEIEAKLASEEKSA